MTLGSFLIKNTDNNLIFFGSGTAKQLNGSNVTDICMAGITAALQLQYVMCVCVYVCVDARMCA